MTLIAVESIQGVRTLSDPQSGPQACLRRHLMYAKVETKLASLGLQTKTGRGFNWPATPRCAKPAYDHMPGLNTTAQLYQHTIHQRTSTNYKETPAPRGWRKLK